MEEVLLVLERSTRTQVAIVLGLLAFMSMLWLGHHLAADLVVEGTLAPMQEALRERIIGRSEKAAFGGLIMFWALAYRSYRRDRKRLFGD
jgi:hypothetical protein